MPTDEERRTIARRLRRCSPTLDNALTFLRVFEAVYGTLPEDGAAMGMPRRLATLIDRPTTRRVCKNPMAIHEKWPCERCGFSIGDRRWKYCPNCGAEVVDD